MKKIQPFSAKMGEVKFRRKLLEQHLGTRTYYPTHASAEDNLEILRTRALNSLSIFKKLQKEHLLLSPFLEIGAEKCGRSAALSSRMKTFGAAIDISAESLESASVFCPKLGLPKLPLRICADAYNLPFADNSFPFIFTFQTLHHFPDPKPILKEIYRVLSPGGLFYFDEEPVKQIVNLPLWRRDFHLRWFEKLLKAILILPFISLIGKSEVSAGILEETFSFSTWKRALNQFDSVRGELIPFPFGPKTIYQKPDKNWLKGQGLTRIILFFCGGSIKAFCRKEGKLLVPSENIDKLLTCPECGGRVQNQKNRLSCLKCQKHYPVKNNVIYLLKHNLLKKFYPGL